MDFITAIKTCLSKFVTFSGRARRAEFWWFALFTFLASLALGVVDTVIFGVTTVTDNGFNAYTTFSPLSDLFSLAMLLPSLAVAARRLHDTDRTAWWLLMIFLPIIGWIVLLVFYVGKGTHGSNRFGPDPLGQEAEPEPVTYSSSSIPPVDRED